MTTLKRIIKLGLINFWRNWWLSMAASLMIMLTLLTMGTFGILSIFANSTAEGIKDRIDLAVYFYENATEDQIKELQYQLANRSDVKSVHYVSKDEALAEWQQRSVTAKIKQLINKDKNPLPRNLQIKPSDPESIDAIASFVQTEQYKPYIRKITYEETKEPIEKLIRITHFIRRLGWVVSGFLLVISLIVILNTIRLTIFTRRDEIEIMRLVGANNAFIRIPFSVEAVLYGVVGALLAYLAVCQVMAAYGTKVAAYFADVAVAGSTSYFYLINPYFDGVLSGKGFGFAGSFIHLWQLGLLQLAIGILFSVCCSMLAMRRYLRI